MQAHRHWQTRIILVMEKKPKKILLLTSSGGGGHLLAAQAYRLRALSEDPSTVIIEKDILIDYVGKRFGNGCVYLWNTSQKKGNLPLLNFLSMNIPLADFLFYLHFFFHVLFTIIKEDIDQVVDTQPLGTSVILRALKWARRITNKPLKLEKIITELPTDQVHHFFKPIKGLTSNSRSFLKLITSTPLLRQNQTADAFWEKNCGLSEKEVCYERFPLRPSFKDFEDPIQYANKRMNIEIRVHSGEEKFLIADTIKLGSLHSEYYRDKIVINIEPDDKVSTILLGSQPSEDATIKYVENYIKMMRNAHKEERHLLFVFCNSHTEHKNSLLKRMHDFVQKVDDYPMHLTIIPMCFQNDEVIAPLYYRSNATFTRSGGLTSMELLSVATGQIWIHSEMRRGTTDEKKLCRGMPSWEQGNATYLQVKKGARFTSPEIFSVTCESYFLPSETSTAKTYSQTN